ncbi:hypothetical protein [Rhodoblastus sp.]|uniref:hypothetical protein n=1 Tax=Rhodoblastus sp. TaxID=1962975 RepID=UPI003F9DB464
MIAPNRHPTPRRWRWRRTTLANLARAFAAPREGVPAEDLGRINDRDAALHAALRGEVARR